MATNTTLYLDDAKSYFSSTNGQMYLRQVQNQLRTKIKIVLSNINESSFKFFKKKLNARGVPFIRQIPCENVV